MNQRARDNLRSWLETMDALVPWADAGNPALQPFVDAFERARERALGAAPAYAEAAAASSDTNLRAWLADMAALKRWADLENPEHAPFVDAFSAARTRALAAAERLAGEG
jgi:tRNA U34 5-methylaminomethyl-2-thiouridine-forming methyltransferase MnmC